MIPNEKYLGTKCAKCHHGTMIETDNSCEWWVRCDDCGHLVFCYEPMPHQQRFHSDSAKFKLYGGGYGSAKTSTGCAEMLMLAMTTPNGVGLVGAHTYPQLEQTAKKQILDMLPSELIRHYDKQRNILTLTNGYIIMFKSFDDEQKLRSLNLCHAYIEEANGTDFSIFTQLQTRLRHHATNDHKIIMSTNPDNNWVKTEILLKADKIYGSKETYRRPVEDRNPNISVHIARTDMNTYLPPNYIEDIKVGKSSHWIARYLEGSFTNASGMVYPNFEQNIVNDVDYDTIVHNVQHKGWQVIGSGDFGLLDDTVLLLAAIDPVYGDVYVYDEYVRNRVSIGVHAAEMKKRMAHIPIGGLLKLVGDPSGAKRSQTDLKTIFNHYQEHGVYFQKGNNKIDAGIQKVYSYLEMGKLKILPHLTHLIKEAANYIYKPVEEGKEIDEKPVGGKDHCLDGLRYMVVELPDDPLHLSTESYNAADFRTVNKMEVAIPFELQDNDSLDYSKDSWYNNY